MSKTTKKVWMLENIQRKMEYIPELENLIKDFIRYKKGELAYNNGVAYINAKYLIGKDVPYDRPPMDLKDDGVFHAHILENGSADHKQASKRFNFNRQERWTSNCFLVYCTHWSNEDYIGIFDFDENGHSFSRQKKDQFIEWIEEFESMIDDGEEVKVW
ncbi:type II toxin-antitoxin system YafO family toxin [Microbulbifer sp. SSSA008]|uniref:type II toxin-antitoxin system YafO family toxin n=1 Tax=Microbulbifer sp. SSSA008 TaxID=3243380 RepID=UPI004039FF2A